MDAREDEFEEARVREEKAAKRAAAVRERERKEGTEKEKEEAVKEWPVVGNLEWLDVDSVSGFRVREISRGRVDPSLLQYSAIKLQGTGRLF